MVAFNSHQVQMGLYLEATLKTNKYHFTHSKTLFQSKLPDFYFFLIKCLAWPFYYEPVIILKNVNYQYCRLQIIVLALVVQLQRGHIATSVIFLNKIKLRVKNNLCLNVLNYSSKKFLSIIFSCLMLKDKFALASFLVGAIYLMYILSLKCMQFV